MEKQIAFDFGEVVGVRYTCPECKREWYLSRADLRRYYEGADAYPFCLSCVQDDKKARMLRDRFEGEFRYLAGIVCGLTEFTKIKLRLIVGEIPSETVQS